VGVRKAKKRRKLAARLLGVAIYDQLDTPTSNILQHVLLIIIFPPPLLLYKTSLSRRKPDKSTIFVNMLIDLIALLQDHVFFFFFFYIQKRSRIDVSSGINYFKFEINFN